MRERFTIFFADVTQRQVIFRSDVDRNIIRNGWKNIAAISFPRPTVLTTAWRHDLCAGTKFSLCRARVQTSLCPIAMLTLRWLLR
jgi:hypothetical protein